MTQLNLKGPIFKLEPEFITIFDLTCKENKVIS